MPPLLTTATPYEMVWTFLSVIGMLATARGAYHAWQQERALKRLGLNGPRTIIAMRDTRRHLIYLAVLGLVAAIGTTFMFSAPNTPVHPIVVGARVAIPFMAMGIVGLLVIAAIGDEVARGIALRLIEEDQRQAREEERALQAEENRKLEAMIVNLAAAMKTERDESQKGLDKPEES